MGGSQNFVLGLHARLMQRLSLYFLTEKGGVKKHPCGHLRAKCIYSLPPSYGSFLLMISIPALPFLVHWSLGVNSLDLLGRSYSKVQWDPYFVFWWKHYLIESRTFDLYSI